MKTRYVVGLTGFFLVAAGAFFAPMVVLWKIHHDHHDVTVDDVQIGWHRLALFGVHVDRPNLKGTFKQVLVDTTDESLDVRGGTVSYVSNGEHHGTGDEKHSIRAEGLTVHAVKGPITADAENVSVNGTEVCADGGTITGVDDRIASIKFEHGCVTRDFTDGTAAGVRIALSPDVQIPEPFGASEVKLTDVNVSIPKEHVSIASVVFGDTHAHDVAITRTAGRVFVAMGSLTLEHKRAFVTPLTFRDVHTSLDPKNLRGDAITVEAGGAKTLLDPKSLGATGDEECSTWLAALPEQMHVDAFDGLKLKGRLSFDLHLKPRVKLAITNTCKAEKPTPAVEALRGVFRYTAYDKDGQPFERQTGPGSDDWTALEDVSQYMPYAVMNLEDKGFLHHHGIIPAALENSLTEDYERGKFVRGGSTITMQLAKNLWLSRTKTIGRKVQEFFLTTALESSLSKNEIMELYLNVVEFGPNLYGIGDAAHSYFALTPHDLDPTQSFYLASILPKPRKAPKPDEKTMTRVAALMKTLADRGSLDDSMLAAPDVWEVGE